MVNPIVNPDFKLSRDGVFLVIDDFLLNIDEFREQLMALGEFTHHRKNPQVVDVGPTHDWRQIISSKLFPEAFNSAIAKFQGVTKPADFYGTNLFYSDMKIETRKLRSSHFPHTDHVVGQGNVPIVFNLWLHDGGGGTGFYTYDGHHTSSSMSDDLRYFVENYAHAKPPEDTFKYESHFAGDADWKLWKIAEMKKNRAFVYCGDFWHRILIPEDQFNFPDPRFSFVVFSQADSDKFLRESGSLPYLSSNPT